MLISILACSLGFHAITFERSTYFYDNRHFKNQASVALNPLVSPINRLLQHVARPFSLRMHVNGNYNGNYHICTHAIQRVEREGSSHTRLHTHMSVHWGYRDMMSMLYMCWYKIEISHYIRLTCGHSNSTVLLYDTMMGLSLTPNTV